MRKGMGLFELIFAIILFGIVFAIAIPKVSTTDSTNNGVNTRQNEINKVAENKAKEKKLLAELKKIPASEIYTNKTKYKELLNMFPENQKYKNKYSYYSNKVRAVEQSIGKIPQINPWNSVPYIVERYMKKIANDPDSIEFDGCTGLTYSDKGYFTKCKVRGKNAFGAKILSIYSYQILHGRVVNVLQR